VLAVGDADFQAKCYRHIEGLRAAGVTIVIVSHDLPAVERFSDRVVQLSHGRIVCEGTPAEVIASYLAGLG
jgi:ABC-type polysaccharide/polyol phosphate transport system ATPase subunit